MSSIDRADVTPTEQRRRSRTPPRGEALLAAMTGGGVIPDPAAMAEHAGSASDLLKALANPNRLMILCVLSEGELSVGALNMRIPVSQSALSQHLARLRKDGLVATRRESQTIYYRLSPGPALGIIEILHDHYCRPPECRNDGTGRA